MKIDRRFKIKKHNDAAAEMALEENMRYQRELKKETSELSARLKFARECSKDNRKRIIKDIKDLRGYDYTFDEIGKIMGYLGKGRKVYARNFLIRKKK